MLFILRMWRQRISIQESKSFSKNTKLNVELLYKILLIWKLKYIFRRQMAFWLPQFDKIKDFSSFQKQLQTLASKLQSRKLDIQNTAKTSDSELKITRESRSIKKSTRIPEMSFDRDLIKEHTEAFDFKIQSYFQQMFLDNDLGSKPLMNERIFPKKQINPNNSNQLQYYLASSDSLLQQKKIQMLMEDLRYQQKLYEFLSYVCANSCDKVAFQFIFIVNAIWQQYIQIQHFQYPYQKLIQQSKKLTEFVRQMIQNDSQIEYFTLVCTKIKPALNPQERNQQYTKIIQFLIITIFLIISQYYANPFYQDKLQSQLKRHVFFNNYTHQDSFQGFSENEESKQMQYFLKGRKKLQ